MNHYTATPFFLATFFTLYAFFGDAGAATVVSSGGWAVTDFDHRKSKNAVRLTVYKQPAEVTWVKKEAEFMGGDHLSPASLASYTRRAAETTGAATDLLGAGFRSNGAGFEEGHFILNALRERRDVVPLPAALPLLLGGLGILGISLRRRRP